ncbi:unnamed protein product [Cochlearia groenlandica]
MIKYDLHLWDRHIKEIRGSPSISSSNFVFIWDFWDLGFLLEIFTNGKIEFSYSVRMKSLIDLVNEGLIVLKGFAIGWKLYNTNTLPLYDIFLFHKSLAHIPQSLRNSDLMAQLNAQAMARAMAAKGKGTDLKTTTMRLRDTDMDEKVKKFSLNLIGRLLNPNVQRIDYLLENLPKIWKLQDKAVGLDYNKLTGFRSKCFKLTHDDANFPQDTKSEEELAIAKRKLVEKGCVELKEMSNTGPKISLEKFRQVSWPKLGAQGRWEQRIFVLFSAYTLLPENDINSDYGVENEEEKEAEEGQ